MAKKKDGASSQQNGVFVQFDDVVMKQLKRQAERRFSSVQGAVQSYIRDATLQQLREDMADEKTEAKEVEAQ